MRLFDHEYSFPHPWRVVTAASWQKYPNPEWTPHVTNVDYLSRRLDERGRLITERLLTCQQAVPSLLTRIVGAPDCPASIVYERSIVDPMKQEMLLETRNLSFSDWIVVEERCEYRPDPLWEQSRTWFSQQCRFRCPDTGWSWLTDQVEEFCLSRFQANAVKGKKALEEAIERFEQFCTDF